MVKLIITYGCNRSVKFVRFRFTDCHHAYALKIIKMTTVKIIMMAIIKHKLKHQRMRLLVTVAKRIQSVIALPGVSIMRSIFKQCSLVSSTTYNHLSVLLIRIHSKLSVERGPSSYCLT